MHNQKIKKRKLLDFMGLGTLNCESTWVEYIFNFIFLSLISHCWHICCVQMMPMMEMKQQNLYPYWLSFNRWGPI